MNKNLTIFSTELIAEAQAQFANGVGLQGSEPDTIQMLNELVGFFEALLEAENSTKAEPSVAES